MSFLALISVTTEQECDRWSWSQRAHLIAAASVFSAVAVGRERGCLGACCACWVEAKERSLASTSYFLLHDLHHLIEIPLV